jgi:hypothetical protein
MNALPSTPIKHTNAFNAVMTGLSGMFSISSKKSTDFRSPVH